MMSLVRKLKEQEIRSPHPPRPGSAPKGRGGLLGTINLAVDVFLGPSVGGRGVIVPTRQGF